MTPYLDQIKWNEAGLVPVVAQDATSKQLLTLAWANREALQTSLKEGRAVYWSRSRSRLWRKGEQSGNKQRLLGVYLDCDGDALRYEVEQHGVACHTGRPSCFYRKLEDGRWREVLIGHDHV